MLTWEREGALNGGVPFKFQVFFGGSIVAFIFIALACTFLVRAGLGPWLELFNGATWPTRWLSDAKGVQPNYDFWFCVIVAARTFLNLGIILSALLAISWLAAGGLGRMIVKQVETIARMRTAALVGEMIRVLERAGVRLDPEVEEQMYETASHFDERSRAGAAFRKGAEAARRHEY